MQPDYTGIQRHREIHPLRSLILLTGMILLGMSLGSLLAAFGIVLFSAAQGGGTSVTELAELLQHPENVPNGWYILMAVQGVSHVCSFLLPCLIYWYFVERRRWVDFQDRSLADVSGLSLVVLLVIAFMPFNGIIIEWNQDLKLPETLAPVEQWMRQREDELAGITKYLTTFKTTGQMLIALFIIAIIPAIGEETLFRGILQRNFIKWTGNVHVGIWLAAALFSAIHVQFYGFFPRMMLGALFGYLYVWSGNLWVPILAHFVNNGFTVIMVYLYQQKLVSMNIEETESVPVLGALVSFVFSLAILLYFRRSNESQARLW